MAGMRRAGRIPFGYRPGGTFLHRAPAAFKLVCVLALSSIAFASVYGLAVSVVLAIALSAAARIKPWELLKGSRPLLPLSLCVMLIKSVRPGEAGRALPGLSAQGLCEGAFIVLRIFVPYAAAALFFAVTTMKELRLSIAKIELKLKNVLGAGRKGKKGVAFFSLGITLMLGFIPRFFELWENSGLACEARSCKNGPRRLLRLVPLVTERMMESAADTALAMEARALGYDE